MHAFSESSWDNAAGILQPGSRGLPAATNGYTTITQLPNNLESDIVAWPDTGLWNNCCLSDQAYHDPGPAEYSTTLSQAAYINGIGFHDAVDFDISSVDAIAPTDLDDFSTLDNSFIPEPNVYSSLFPSIVDDFSCKLEQSNENTAQKKGNTAPQLNAPTSPASRIATKPKPRSKVRSSTRGDEARIHCSNGACTQTFRRVGDFRRHMKKHEPSKFTCIDAECGKTFYRLDKLRDHLKHGHKLNL